MTKEEELEQENAELKEQIEKLGEQNIKDCENFNRVMAETNEQWNKEHYQFTKAKKIIKSLLETPRTVHKRDSEGEVVPFENMAYARLKEEAEQFLSEVENGSRT